MHNSPFWQLEHPNVQVQAVQSRAWLWCLLGSGAAVLSAWLVGAVSSTGFGWVWSYLAVLLLAHLYTRGRIRHELPAPNFARDVQTGNLEQFRLLPVPSHWLVLQRALPGLFHRFQTMVLFLPAYALWGAMVGLPLLDGLLFWALFSFTDYRLLLLFSIYLLLPFEQLEITCLLTLVFGYVWIREADDAQFGKQTGLVFGLIIALCVLSRIPMGVRFALVLPDFRLIAFALLLVEGVRFDRLSRWLNAVSGVWQYFHLLPCAGLLFLVQYLFMQIYYNPAWSIESRAAASLAAVFCLTGWLGILTGTYERAGRALQEPFRHHLREIALLRGVSVLVAFVSMLLYGVPFTPMTGTVCGLFALFSLPEVGVQSLLRVRLQFYGVLNRRVSGYAAIAVLGLLPFVLAGLPLSIPSYGILLSPTVALLAPTPVWASIHAPFPTTALSIPLILVIGMPLLRYLLVAWLLARAPRPESRWTSLALRLLNAFMLSPLLENRILRNSRNPVYATMLLTSRQSRAWVFYLPALLLGIANEWGQLLGLLFWLTVPLIGLLWYSGYQGVLRRARKIIHSGEFTGWLMSKLTDSEIFWGIVYGGWWQQARTLIAIGAGLLMGQLLRGLFLLGGLPGLTLSKGVLFGITAGLILTMLSVGATLLCLVLLTAPPMAVQDALIEADARATGKPQTGVKSLFYSVLFGIMALPCCALFSPLALIGLPIFSSQAFNLLKTIRRAPAERLRA
jgi:hypothetical protein